MEKGSAVTHTLVAFIVRDRNEPLVTFLPPQVHAEFEVGSLLKCYLFDVTFVYDITIEKNM